MKFGSPSPDSRIFILGAGIIGNLWAVTLHHNGLRNITLTEPFQKRREITKKMCMYLINNLNTMLP
jgi:threonine dehydrogenase-like Zn-dependent dehydrogenase